VKERKIIKAKRQIKKDEKEEIEQGSDGSLEFEGSDVEELEPENVEQKDSEDSENEGEWEDCEDDEMADESKPTKKEIWDSTKEPLKDDEELEYDGSAYVMLHRCKVEWPCLSVDFLLRERSSEFGPLNPKSWFPSQMNGQLAEGDTILDRHNIKKHRNDKFPMTVYMVAGSQAEKKSENKIYVMKWSEMYKTVNEDDEDSESDEEPREPIIRYESIPHRGAVNRVRSMHGTSIVATWNEDEEVGIYNVAPALEELDQPYVAGKKPQKKTFGNTKVASFKHKSEGYALEWSPHTYGRLASGTCDAQLWLYQAADEGCSSFVKETQVGLQGHKHSIEDI